MIINWNKHIESWNKVAKTPSGNYASNLPLDQDLLDNLMENRITDEYFENQIKLAKTEFPKLENSLNKVNGLNILSGLHKLSKKYCITVFRAVRFPTPRRILNMAKESGISILNYEHERLLRIYEDPEYKLKRQNLKSDPKFSFLPQERIVPGLPIFFSANDAIHIHRAYRNENDMIGFVAAFIPYELVKSAKIEIFSNYALVQSYADSEGDKKINYFRQLTYNKRVIPFYKALNLEGNLIYETYCNGFPESLSESNKLGIEQRFFLLKIYKPDIDEKNKKINGIELSEDLIVSNPYFLFGFWGDDNIFMRRPSEYLPKTCYEIMKK